MVGDKRLVGMSCRVQTAVGVQSHVCRAMLPQGEVHWSAQLIFLAMFPRETDAMNAPAMGMEAKSWVQQYFEPWVRCLNEDVAGQVVAGHLHMAAFPLPAKPPSCNSQHCVHLVVMVAMSH